LYIYIAADNLLNLFLTISGTSLCNCVTNTRIDRYYKIDDNFVLIIRVQVSYNLLQTLFIVVMISGAFEVFV
jgi:hypothetical protein